MDRRDAENRLVRLWNIIRSILEMLDNSPNMVAWANLRQRFYLTHFQD